MSGSPRLNMSVTKMPSSFVGSNGREYSIGSQLGTGSSGTVFTCTDMEDDSVYAVKVVKLNHMRMSMSGEEYEHEKQKLHREVNILRNLSHPNIVRLIDVSESNDSVYVVQELVEGGELFSRITDDPDFRNENVIKFVYCQLADAVLYLHSKAVIHRDIKPENILVQTCGTRPPVGFDAIPNCPVYPVIKVVDFGLSKELSTLSTFAQTWVGTPQYWAPEVIRSRDTGSPYDGRSDIWSIGVLLFVCLFRRYPFSEPKLPGDLPMQERILKGQFAFPTSSRVSEEARDLIKQLIVPDVDKRATLESTFVHEWLKAFSPAKALADRWPISHSLSVETALSVTMADDTETPPGLVSEPSSSSHAGSPVLSPQIAGAGDDIVPFIFPTAAAVALQPAASGPIIPNIAMAQRCAVDQFQLSELARVQNEILSCFVKIQTNFNLHPNAYHLMATLITRARELQFLSATSVSKFAITAEAAEAVIDDSSVFVHAGAVEASLDCVEEIRNSVSEMLAQCREVQEQYRALLEDVNNLIAGSRIVLNNDPTVRQAIEDILRTESSRQSSVSPPRQNTVSSTSANSVESIHVGNRQRLSLNKVVASALNVEMASPSARTDSENAENAVVPSEATERLLSSSLRDLKRVDDILGKCRFFWTNMEQCLLRLDMFKTTSYRLLQNVHVSPALMERYDVRVAEHRAFWSQFKQTCTEYAQVSQIEYQKFRQ